MAQRSQKFLRRFFQKAAAFNVKHLTTLSDICSPHGYGRAELSP
jgi:hypothetical protein